MGMINRNLKRRYVLDKSFGPTGSFAGILLFIAGLIIIWFSLPGLALVVLGAFVGFTSTSTRVDYKGMRIRFTNDLFGLIPIGQWVIVQPDMKIGIKKSQEVWRAYSRGNRSMDTAVDDYRLILCNADALEVMQIKKAKTLEEALEDRTLLSGRLGIGVI